MIDNYSISGSKIIFEAGRIAEFDFLIKKAMTFNHYIIVLLDIPSRSSYNQNVFAINYKGRILWQIDGLEIHSLTPCCPFISIEIRNRELVCLNACGFRFTVNPATGKVTSQVFTK